MQSVRVERLDQTTLWVDEAVGLRPASGDYLLNAVVARSPVVVSNPARRSEDLPAAPTAKVAGLSSSRVLGVRDVLLLGRVGQIYHREGCPEHRWVPISLNEAAEAMVYSGRGSRQRALAWEAAVRLHETALTWTEWRRGLPGPVELHFHLFERVWAIGGENSQTGMQFSIEGADLMRHSALTYLRAATAQALVMAGGDSARLWLFLESERMTERHYRLFRAAPGEDPAADYAAPVIAEVLGLDHWQQRKRVAFRVQKAIETIERIDGDRWNLRLERQRKAGMWVLHVRRSRRPRPEFSTRVGTPRNPVADTVGTDRNRGWVLTGTEGGYRQEPRVGTDRNPALGNPLQKPTVSESYRPALSRPALDRPVSHRQHDRTAVAPGEEGIPGEADRDQQRVAPAVSRDRTPFTAFWQPYPRHEGEREARRLWQRLTDEQRRLAAGVSRLMGPLVARGVKERRYVPTPVTFLRDERWEDWRDGVPAGWQTQADRNAALIADAIARAERGEL